MSSSGGSMLAGKNTKEGGKDTTSSPRKPVLPAPKKRQGEMDTEILD